MGDVSQEELNKMRDRMVLLEDCIYGHGIAIYELRTRWVANYYLNKSLKNIFYYLGKFVGLGFKKSK